MYKLFLNVTKGDSELHGNRLFFFFFSLSIKSIFKYVQSTLFIADTVGP